MTEFMIEQKAEERLNTIKTTRQSLKIMGTKYYVSNDGDDQNDGLTPETAWKTLQRVNSQNDIYGTGDAVLFRCGDTFRGSIQVRSITYSSFGYGEKPHLYASPFNAANLVWTNEGNDIYSLTFNQKYADIGNIVFNNGEAYGIKKWFLIGTEVEFDLDFYHDTENNKLYLKSTKGNPEKRYDSIELGVKVPVFSGHGEHCSNCTIDGLIIKYSGGCIISFSDGMIVNNTVRNCEIGWVGGSIMNPKIAVLYGNGYQLWGSCDGVLIENCYFNQCYDAAVTPQWSGKPVGPVVKNFIVRNCLFERNIYDFEYFLNEYNFDENGNRLYLESPNTKFVNVSFENNICRKTGYGFGAQRIEKADARCIRSGANYNPAENFVIKNNIFDRSDNLLVEISSQFKEQIPVLKGNVYCQHEGKGFMIKNCVETKFTKDFFKSNSGFCEEDATIIFAQRPLDK